MAVNYAAQYTLGFNTNTNAAKKELQALQTTLKQISNMSIDLVDDDAIQNIKMASDAAMELNQALSAATNVKTGKLDLSAFQQSLSRSGKNVQDLISQLTLAGKTGQTAFAQLARSITNAHMPLKESSRLLNDFAVTMKNTVKWQLSSNIVHGLQSGLDGAIRYAKDLNSSLTDIRIVTGASADEMARFANSANAAAKRLSTSTLDYTKASLIYYQQGDSDAEVAKKAELTIKAANASTESTTQEMSEYLTAVWNSYKAGSDELTHFVDVMASLGAKTATSMEEIAGAMQKVASVGNSVGVEFEQLSSIIATVSSVTRQSAETVGTSFKTILARIGDLKLGETLEDGVTLGQVSSQLDALGIHVLDVNGDLRDMGGVIEEIGAKWQTMNRATQTALAQSLAGKRQYTQLVALFDNWDMYNQNVDYAEDSEGALQKMQDTYAESWEAASKRVKASMENVYTDIINDKAIIAMTNALADMIDKVHSLVDAFGGFESVLGVVSTVLTKTMQPRIAEGINSMIANIKISTGLASKEFIKTQNDLMGELTNNILLTDEDSQIIEYYDQLRQSQQTFLSEGKTYTSAEIAQIQSVIDKIHEEIDANIQLIQIQKQRKQETQAGEENLYDTMVLNIASDAVGGKESWDALKFSEQQQRLQEAKKDLFESIDNAEGALNHEEFKEVKTAVETLRTSFEKTGQSADDFVSEIKTAKDVVAAFTAANKQIGKNEALSKQIEATKTALEKHTLTAEEAIAQYKNILRNADIDKAVKETFETNINTALENLSVNGDFDKFLETVKIEIQNITDQLNALTTQAETVSDKAEKAMSGATTQKQRDQVKTSAKKEGAGMAVTPTSPDDMRKKMDTGFAQATQEAETLANKMSMLLSGIVGVTSGVATLKSGIEELISGTSTLGESVIVLITGFAQVASSIGDLIGNWSAIHDAWSKAPKLIKAINTSLAQKTLATKLSAVADKLAASASATIIAKSGAEAAAHLSVAAAIKAKTAALIASMATNPLGWIAAIAAALVGIVSLINAISKAQEEQEKEAAEIAANQNERLKERNDKWLEEDKAVEEVIATYKKLHDEYEQMDDDKKIASEEYVTATESVLKALGLEQEQVLLAAGYYDELAVAIDRANRARLQNAAGDDVDSILSNIGLTFAAQDTDKEFKKAYGTMKYTPGQGYIFGTDFLDKFGKSAKDFAGRSDMGNISWAGSTQMEHFFINVLGLKGNTSNMFTDAVTIEDNPQEILRIWEKIQEIESDEMYNPMTSDAMWKWFSSQIESWVGQILPEMQSQASAKGQLATMDLESWEQWSAKNTDKTMDDYLAYAEQMVVESIQGVGLPTDEAESIKNSVIQTWIEGLSFEGSDTLRTIWSKHLANTYVAENTSMASHKETYELYTEAVTVTANEEVKLDALEELNKWKKAAPTSAEFQERLQTYNETYGTQYTAETDFDSLIAIQRDAVATAKNTENTARGNLRTSIRNEMFSILGEEVNEAVTDSELQHKYQTKVFGDGESSGIIDIFGQIWKDWDTFKNIRTTNKLNENVYGEVQNTNLENYFRSLFDETAPGLVDAFIKTLGSETTEAMNNSWEQEAIVDWTKAFEKFVSGYYNDKARLLPTYAYGAATFEPVTAEDYSPIQTEEEDLKLLELLTDAETQTGLNKMTADQLVQLSQATGKTIDDLLKMAPDEYAGLWLTAMDTVLDRLEAYENPSVANSKATSSGRASYNEALYEQQYQIWQDTRKTKQEEGNRAASYATAAEAAMKDQRGTKTVTDVLTESNILAEDFATIASEALGRTIATGELNKLTDAELLKINQHQEAAAATFYGAVTKAGTDFLALFENNKILSHLKGGEDYTEAKKVVDSDTEAEQLYNQSVSTPTYASAADVTRILDETETLKHLSELDSQFAALDDYELNPGDPQKFIQLGEALDLTNPKIREYYELIGAAETDEERETAIDDMTNAILTQNGALLTGSAGADAYYESWKKLYGITDEFGDVLSTDVINGFKGLKKYNKDAIKQNTQMAKTLKNVRKGYEDSEDSLDGMIDAMEDLNDEEKKQMKALDDMYDAFDDLGENEGFENMGENFADALLECENESEMIDTFMDTLMQNIENMANNSGIENLWNSMANNMQVNANMFTESTRAMFEGVGADVTSVMSYVMGQIVAAGGDLAAVDWGEISNTVGVDVQYIIAALQDLLAAYQAANSTDLVGLESVIANAQRALSAVRGVQNRYGGGGGRAKNANTGGKGNGGGGGSKSKTKEDKLRAEDEIERYHEQNEVLDRVGEKLDAIDKLKDRTYGKNHLAQLDAETEALKEQLAAQADLYNEANKWRASDQKKLINLEVGVKFDADGNIANYEEVMAALIEKQNANIERYNNSDQDEGDKAQLEADKQWYEDAVKAIENYEEALKTGNEALIEMEEIRNQISELELEKITYKLEVETELNDNDLELLEYYMDKWEDDLDKQANRFMKVTDSITVYQDNLANLNNALNELNEQHQNGTINEADYAEGVQDIRDQIMENLENLEDAGDQLKEIYSDALELAREEIEKTTDAMQHSSDVMESYISIMGLMGKANDFEQLQAFYDAQYTYGIQQIGVLKSTYDTLIEARAEYDAKIEAGQKLSEVEQANYDALQEKIRETEEEMLDATESTLEVIKAGYENTVNAMSKDLEEFMVGAGNSIAGLADQYAYFQEKQDRYVSTAKELFEVSKLNRDIENSLADATTDASKEALKALQEKINKQSELNELTEYDIQMNQLEYQLLLARIQLEEASSSKDTVRLTRDENGNYAYQYTADQDKVNQAMQQYEDVLQQINELSVERTGEIEQQMIDAMQNNLAKFNEIMSDETLSTKERNDKIADLNTQFGETMLYLQEQAEIAGEKLTWNQEMIADHFGVALSDITASTAGNVNESVQAMIDRADEFAAKMNAVLTGDGEDSVHGVWDTYKNKLKEVSDASGLNYESMTNKVSDFTHANDLAAGKANEVLDVLKDTLTPLTALTAAWGVHAGVIQDMVQYYESLANAMNEAMRDSANADGGAASAGGAPASTGFEDKGYGPYEVTMPDGTKVTHNATGPWSALAMAGVSYADVAKVNVVPKFYRGGLVDFTGLAQLDGTQTNPELVLNADDTRNMLETVRVVRQLDSNTLSLLVSSLETSVNSMMAFMNNGYHAFGVSGMQTQTLDQNVQITAEFPNVTDHNEIEEAFNSLVNRAAQFAKQK